jgi:hypothetical protein
MKQGERGSRGSGSRLALVMSAASPSLPLTEGTGSNGDQSNFDPRREP